MPIVYEWLDAAPTAAPAQAAEQAPAPAETPATPAGATSVINVAESLDANEVLIAPFTVSKDSIPGLDSTNSEMIGTILAILLCLYVVKVLLSLLPRVILIGIGVAVVYAFLR